MRSKRNIRILFKLRSHCNQQGSRTRDKQWIVFFCSTPGRVQQTYFFKLLLLPANQSCLHRRLTGPQQTCCVSPGHCVLSAKRSEAKRVAVSAFFTLKVLVNFEILSSSKVEVSHVFIVVIKCTLQSGSGSGNNEINAQVVFGNALVNAITNGPRLNCCSICSFYMFGVR